MKEISDAQVDAIAVLPPEKRLGLILFFLFEADVLDDDEYVFALEAATQTTDESPS